MPLSVLTSRVAVGASAALTATVLLAGCTSQPVAHSTNADSAGAVVSSLGAVPIPTAPKGVPAPVSASIGHPQLIAMGAPVQVTLPGGTAAVITASGPATNPPPGQTKANGPVTGVIAITVTPSAGTVRLAAADLHSRDQTGQQVSLTPVGPASATATPGHPATVRLSGTFSQGDAQINWQQAGHVLAIWDFTIESD
jgi:hypothetical protein